MILSRLALAAYFYTQILAVPTSERLSVQAVDSFTPPRPCSPRSASSPFRRLRDSIIEKIWDVPHRSNCGKTAAEPDHTVHGRHRRRYDNEIVLRFNISSPADTQAFTDAATTLYLDIWDSTSKWIDVRIARRLLPSLLEVLPPSLQDAHMPLIYDLAKAVDETYPCLVEKDSWRMQHSPLPGIPRDIFFDNYQPLSVIYPWLKLFALEHPEIVQLMTIGTSAEGRDIIALRIRSPKAHLKPYQPRPTVLLTAGSHGREWISISTATFIAHSLISRLIMPTAGDRTTLRFLSQFDIVFVPILNPDGYVFTWTTDRLWRKTRQSTFLPFCPGIDLGRNFPFNWDGSTETDNPCTDSYAGSAPLEAVEARVLSDWIRTYTADHKAEIAAYVDLHSYSQQILFPYAYSCADLPTNYEDLVEIALGLSKSLRSVKGGQLYSVSSACEIVNTPPSPSPSSSSNKTASTTPLPGFGGSALDYIYHDVGVKYAFQIKLRDQGSYGYLLPAREIVPSGCEAVSAIHGLGEWLLGDRGIESDAMPDDGMVTGEEEVADLDEAQQQDGDTFGVDGRVKREDNMGAEGGGEEQWARIFDPHFELDLRRRRR